MSDNSYIPKSILPHLDEIASRLWNGRAVVMIGSGFSRNAKQLNAGTNRFPTWDTLGDIFYEEIHGKLPPESKSRYLNPIKLASEVEALFDRPLLDKILKEAIPDQDYTPSDLHEKLLKLPWVDILTTNYDTLLERASDAIFERNYQLVMNKDDLVAADKPRIIKLHGSFPSTKPFILTEEDYRRYPRDFAPFINTVHQSLLENTLCLIGFSGDDPNFNQWIGWIRDNLGQGNGHKIYIISVRAPLYPVAVYQILPMKPQINFPIHTLEHNFVVYLFLVYLNHLEYLGQQSSHDEQTM